MWDKPTFSTHQTHFYKLWQKSWNENTKTGTHSFYARPISKGTPGGGDNNQSNEGNE